ncbi:MAG: hypothetical protein IPI73_24050 [Betaproteobacteria bacterium]|nr:hypothetical protein [Betaproteobacteria bacterium]
MPGAAQVCYFIGNDAGRHQRALPALGARKVSARYFLALPSAVAGNGLQCGKDIHGRSRQDTDLVRATGRRDAHRTGRNGELIAHTGNGPVAYTEASLQVGSAALDIIVTTGTLLTPCTLDVDGNDSQDALTDGLIILRALFGLTGTSVTNGAIGKAPRAQHLDGFEAAPEQQLRDELCELSQYRQRYNQKGLNMSSITYARICAWSGRDLPRLAAILLSCYLAAAPRPALALSENHFPVLSNCSAPVGPEHRRHGRRHRG